MTHTATRRAIVAIVAAVVLGVTSLAIAPGATASTTRAAADAGGTTVITDLSTLSNDNTPATDVNPPGTPPITAITDFADTLSGASTGSLYLRIPDNTSRAKVRLNVPAAGADPVDPSTTLMPLADVTSGGFDVWVGSGAAVSYQLELYCNGTVGDDATKTTLYWSSTGVDITPQTWTHIDAVTSTSTLITSRSIYTDGHTQKGYHGDADLVASGSYTLADYLTDCPNGVVSSVALDLGRNNPSAGYVDNVTLSSASQTFTYRFAAAAPTTHTVTSIAPYYGDGNQPPSTGWYANDGRTTVGTQAAITGAPSDTTNLDGSLTLDTPGSSDKGNVAITAPAGTTLASLTTMSYQALREQASSSTPTAEAGLQLSFSCAGDGTFSGTLVFEPVYQNYAPRNGDNTVTDGQWQTWDAFDGGNAIWWSTHNLPNGGPAAGTYHPLTAYLAACPNATVLQYVINQGSGNPGLTSSVDNVRINGDIWNFAVTGMPSLAVNLPAQLTAGAAPTTFTSTVTDPADGPQVLHPRYDLTITPSSTIGSLQASDVTLEIQTAENPAVWTPVPLTSGPNGTLVGQVGGATGLATPVEPGAQITNIFRASVAGTMKGGTLDVDATLQSVDGTTGEVLATEASAHGSVPVAGPASCPALAGNPAIVRLGYLRLLDRCPDAGGLAYWTAFLDAGHTPTTFATALAQSNERRVALVGRTYQAILQRQADPTGQAYWVTYLGNGGRFDTFVATLASSPELTGQFTSNQALVQALYQRVLNREGDTAGVQYWTNALNNGMSVAQLTSTLAHSYEFATDVINATPSELASFGPGIYQEVLHRSGDTGGVAFWASYFQANGSTFQAEGHLGGSAEFTASAQTFPAS